jgi:hypothetical protein
MSVRRAATDASRLIVSVRADELFKMVTAANRRGGWMAKQVLVTGGASGLVGSHLAEALETRGHSALAMTHILIRTPALESRSSATFTNLPV